MMNPMMGMGGMNPMQAYMQFRNMMHGGKSSEQAHHMPIESFFDDMAYGRKEIPESLKAVVMSVFKENTDNIMAQHGYITEEEVSYDKAAHRKFKEVIEKLRDMPHTEAVRAIDTHFSNVTPVQRKVLVALIGDRSKKKLAENAGITLDEFMHEKHALEHQIK